MNNKVLNLIIFSTGVVTGVIVTYEKIKNKYEEQAQKEIDSMRVYFEKKYVKESTKGNEQKKKDENKKHGIYRANETKKVEYNKIAKTYQGNVTDIDNFSEIPYIISPMDFGEKDDYEKISLTYYADGYLVDEANELVEDIEDCIGSEYINHFGEYEEDSVFVRNGIQKIDYEILYDSREYKKMINNKLCSKGV